MLYYLASAVLVIFCVTNVTQQFGFSVQETNRTATSDAHRQRHGNFINRFQNFQMSCAEEILGVNSSEKFETVMDFLQLTGISLKPGGNNTQNKCLFGCLCKKMGVVDNNNQVNASTLEDFFGQTTREEADVKNATETCVARTKNCKSTDYCEICYEIFRCAQEFNEQTD